ncbi:unnamed protein product, partial [Nesidiocoris tenuis]
MFYANFYVRDRFYCPTTCSLRALELQKRPRETVQVSTGHLEVFLYGGSSSVD